MYHDFRTEPAGVIAYSMPVLNSTGRRLAAGDFFAGSDKQERLRRLNACVRTIRRVIIDPRYRGLGLAARLVRETMEQTGAAMVEAAAVMGRVCGFFERAGMRRFDVPERKESRTLREALIQAGIAEDLWVDAEAVQKRIGQLHEPRQNEIEGRIRRFMEAYGTRRNMPAGVERTRFALSRLCGQPAYFVWLNPHQPIPGLTLKESDFLLKSG